MRTNWKKWGTHPVLLLCVFVIMVVSLVGFSMQPRTLTVIVDGRQQTIRTAAQSTAGIMRDAHIVLNEYDKVDLNTEKLADGSVLTVRSDHHSGRRGDESNDVGRQDRCAGDHRSGL